MNKYSRYQLILLFCLLGLFAAAVATAGEGAVRTLLPKQIESAVIGGIGTTKTPEGHYQPILLIWHIGLDIKPYFPSLEKKPGSLTFILEPQVNPSYHPENNVEFGVGLGFQYRYPFTEKVSGYLLGSTGPHYMTLTTQAQKKGFLFANTVGFGLSYALREKASLDIGYRFRHLSNAGLADPNFGINADFLTVGYSVFF